MRVITLDCPGCGAPASSSTSACERCGRPIVVTSFSDLQHLDVAALRAHARAYADGLRAVPNDVPVNASLGICYLKLRLYADAKRHLRIASDQDALNSELYFYRAVASLHGERPFVAGLESVREALDELGAAVQLDRRPSYLLTRAYVGVDYFRRKYLNPPFDDNSDVAEALSYGVPGGDLAALLEMLGAGFSEFCARLSLPLQVS